MSNDEREPGATFALGDIMFLDFETRSPVEIAAGSDRYARHAQAVMLAWAVGGSPMQVEAVTDFPRTLQWRLMPDEFREFFKRVDRGEAVMCAHQANFDRAIWEQATDFPPTEPWMWIDTKVQCMASGLPAALDDAARYAGGLELKDKSGKALIELFTLPDSTATPKTHPDEWMQFGRYAARDVGAMRGVFMNTRQLPLAEWKEFWAAEAINDRGICIDIPMVTAAAKMAAVDADMSGKELSRLTRGAVFTVNQVARMTAWLNTVLPPDGRDLLVKKYEEIDLETGEITKPRKEALTRDRVVRLLAYLEGQEPLTAPLRVAQRLLQIRLYGGSKTPAKFGRMLQQQVEGVIRNQYVFNGASQTGRFCLAEGSMIRVRTNGVVDEKPIERVTTADEVWDGEAWVHHEGVVFSGDKEVIEHDCVIATPEHVVYLDSNNSTSLGEAKARGARIWQGEKWPI